MQSGAIIETEYYDENRFFELIFPTIAITGSPGQKIKEQILKHLKTDSAGSLCKNGYELTEEHLEQQLQQQKNYILFVAKSKGENIGLRIYLKPDKVVCTLSHRDHESSIIGVFDRAFKEFSAREESKSPAIIGPGPALGTHSASRAEMHKEGSATQTLRADEIQSLRNLALHVRNNTSFWYGGFFGNRKEAELKRIADEISSQSQITPEQAKEYLLKIAHAAMRSRGACRMDPQPKDGHRLPTHSGRAFVEAVYGENRKFKNLSKYLSTKKGSTASLEASDRSSSPNENGNKKHKITNRFNVSVRFNEIYETVEQLAGLKITTGGCLGEDLRVTSPNATPSRPYAMPSRTA